MWRHQMTSYDTTLCSLSLKSTHYSLVISSLLKKTQRKERESERKIMAQILSGLKSKIGEMRAVIREKSVVREAWDNILLGGAKSLMAIHVINTYVCTLALVSPPTRYNPLYQRTSGAKWPKRTISDDPLFRSLAGPACSRRSGSPETYCWRSGSRPGWAWWGPETSSSSGRRRTRGWSPRSDWLAWKVTLLPTLLTLPRAIAAKPLWYVIYIYNVCIFFVCFGSGFCGFIYIVWFGFERFYLFVIIMV